MTDLFVGADAPTEHNTGASDFEVGTRFSVSAAVDIESLDWYLPVNASGHTPLNVRLWEDLGGGSGELLVSAASITDGGAIGWQKCPLAVPYPLVVGKNYIVSCSWTQGQKRGAWAPGANIGGTVSPLVRDAATSDRIRVGSYGFPNVEWDRQAAAVSVTLVSGSGGGGIGDDPDPPTNANLTARLAQWLSSVPATQTHELDGIPWLMYQIVQGMDTLLDTVAEKTNFIRNWTEQNAGLAGTVAGWTIFGYLDDLRNKTQTILDYINPPAGGGTRPIIADIEAVVGAGPNDLRATQDRITMSDVGWVPTQTVVGSGSFVWHVPADRYVLTITEYGSQRPYTEVGTVPYWLHRGFWAVMDGDRVGHYFPLVGHKHMLYEVGHRLQGVLLGLDGDLEWTLTAYDFTS